MTQSPAVPLPPPEERRRLREAASLTRAQLASRVGVSSETVRGWETGRSTPRGRRAEKYAKLLDSLSRPAESPAEMTPHQEWGAASDEVARWRTRRGAGRTALAERDHITGALTPDQAFDALYSFCAPALVRQTYLLTGRRELARESVERAFHTAWQRWPEVACDPDPAGWVRAVAYDCALSPWHRLRPRYRHPEPPPSDASDRALMDALLTLPPSYRRTLLLYDGVGLGLPETAAETEASTRAAANRLMHAREAVAERLPELADPEVLHWRLVELASATRLRAANPLVVRRGGERRARLWTRAAIAFTVVLIGTTALTMRSAPTRYEPPVPEGETVRGVPPRVAPGPLSESELRLRKKLRKEQQRGPDRLLPQPR
ncbi:MULTISPECIES: helix-turn-helix domain-containing protein [unclassified Streptomyces]|uniref:helix-turn-helix domain-containing protein n=1 Tax=unclassified Streptomyces TaxID=2593676 RepID=UPI0004C1D519|nr:MULTISPECIES: helix-turn-helix domain-containing protein [unclassified Streptomyces]